MKVNKLTVASLGFGKGFLNASYNILMTSVLTSMFDNRVPPLAAIGQENKNRCQELELREMKENSQKKESTSIMWWAQRYSSQILSQ